MRSLFILLLLLPILTHGQKYSYEIELEAIDIPELGGLQSYALGTHDGKWLVIGGRVDGLHMRQPWASFDEEGKNNQIFVIDPVGKEVWKSEINNLPTNIREQFSSTNMQFQQHENTLYITGGYGYSPSQDEHITFPYLTVVDIPGMIEDVIYNTDLVDNIIQVEDTLFRVTGGQLSMIGETFYLVGGMKFIGRYNPMGPDHGPGFIQSYTHEIRRFNVSEDNGNISVDHLASIHDEMNLRRRDYNLLPQMNNGVEELMVFSGVFQATANLPWLYPIRIGEDLIEPLPDFSQFYNHYHCSTIPIYNSEEDEMHNIFMGGIAQFYVEDGVKYQDDDVPFVSTIADVSRDENGILNEYILSTKMPALLGAASEFIPAVTAPMIGAEIIDGDKIMVEPQVIGYLYGGIKSDQPNIFFINDGTQSVALSTLYKISLSKKLISPLKETIAGDPTILVYPNPSREMFTVSIDLERAEPVQIDVFDQGGKKVLSKLFKETQVGTNYLRIQTKQSFEGSYMVKIKTDTKEYVQMVVVNL